MRSVLAATATDAFLGTGSDDDVAVLAGERSITYRQLRTRVGERAVELGLRARSLVVLHAANTDEFVVTYLALVRDGHVPLLAGDHADRLTTAWRPHATVTTTSGGVEVVHHHDEARPLHPDLALLLSTSGSTGSPKLVRLSHRNLASNATAIAEYLGLTSADRGITSLPLHYCYGLSVLHSHLAAGAGVVVTSASVVDPCFAAALAEHRVTSLAGVPHTFELLERAGPERIAVPSMRTLTCAGGRLHPEAVGRWIARTEAWGVDLVLMYGQTEATARMAYLPPTLVRQHPDAAGIAIPGGSFSLRPVPDAEPGVGELVYRGDNVMMGYAETDADLALGPTLDELVTGDLARIEDGLVRIVGRRSRFVKPFGLRIDLDQVHAELASRLDGVAVAVAGDDERLAVVVDGARPAPVIAAVADITGLPPGRIGAVTAPVPRTPAGKIDHAAVLRAVPAIAPAEPAPASSSVAAVFAAVLGRVPAPTDTFVSLGGDSLNYVECSVRLERDVGGLPVDWHLLTVAELERRARPAGRWARLDTTVLLRAVGICLIVATHMHLWFVPGGAHLLLGVVGYNVARFLVPVADPRERLAAGLRTVARTAGPTVTWVALGMLLFGSYAAGTLLLVNNYVGPSGHADDHWHFWFIEVLVHLVLLTTLLLAIPAVHRLERRAPYGFALGLLAVALVGRTDWAQWFDPANLRFRTHAIAWFFVLGWLIQRSRTHPQRLLTLAILALTIPGTFIPQRELVIGVGLALLLVAPRLVWPRLAVAPVATIAAASLWILLTHFTVWPILDDALDRRLAYVLTIATGVAVHLVVEQAARALRPGRQAVTAATMSSYAASA